MKPSRIRLFALVLAALALEACGSAGPRPERRDAATLTGEDVEKSHDSVEDLLQKRIPGLVISRGADGNIAVVVRGSTSWDAVDRRPLYILDGAPFHPGPGGTLSGVDPANIDTIKLVRASEATIYGIEGANGVIVITTKKAAPVKP